MLQNTSKKSIYKRLPIYLDFCKELKLIEPDTKNVSSTRIAEELFLGEVQVRKDLSLICGKGKPKIGYSIDQLINSIEEYLKCREMKNAIIIGVGQLGSAIFGFDELKKYGLDIIAGFDINIKEHNTNKNIYLFNEENLKDFLQNNHVDIAVICVPKFVAQEVCNMVTSNGINIIWNFTPTRLKVKQDVIVKNENLAYSVSVLLSEIE